MRLDVVVSCERPDRWLPRTLAALDRALEGEDWSGALEISERPREPLATGPRWTVRAGPEGRGTPGAGRMAGLARGTAPWVLFVDSDIELEPAWARAALDLAAREPGLGGIGGRLEEWFEDGAGARPGRADLHRTGSEDRAADHLAGVALYPRAPLLAAGGYDPRLDSDEDFELGLRLRRGGLELRVLGAVAGRHWSAPRPSLDELARRWRTGLCFGQGEVLRLYAGRPGFGRLLRRQGHYLATLALWGLGAAALAASALAADPRPLAIWALLPAAILAAMAARKRSARLALFSLLTWTQGAAGMVVGWFRISGAPVGSPAGPAALRPAGAGSGREGAPC